MPEHVYVGSDERGDIWQLTDEAGTVLQWAVAWNDDSRAVIDGTLAIVGNESPVSDPVPDEPAPENFDSPPEVAPQLTFGEGSVSSPTNDSPVYEPAPEPEPDIYTPPEPEPDYTSENDEPEPTPEPAPEISAPSAMNLSDSRHVYVGTDNRGDVYQLIDEAGNVLEWAVPVNAASGDVIGGTLRNLGSVSAGTVAQGPAYVPPTSGNVQPVGAGATASQAISPTTAVAADPRHKYVGTDSRGDVYQLVDENGNVIEWAVPVNASSYDMIGGTVRNLGAPSSGTTAQGPAYVPPAPRPGPSVIATGVPGGVASNPNPAPTLASGNGNPQQSDPRHKYVGRDARGDVWQIFDGTNVIEWAVRPGDLSGNMIPGTARNLGVPSPGTIAQNDGTPVGGPTVEQRFGSPTTGGGSGMATVIIGIAGLAISALK